MKNINNIVFYSSSAESKEERNAVVFYEDGTVKSVSYAEAIMMCEQLAKEMGIKKNAFKEMINRDLIHAVTEEEFLNNFHQYLPQEKVVSLEETEAYKKKRLRYQLGAVGAAALLGLTACAYSSRQGNMTSSNIESTVLASDNGEEETVEETTTDSLDKNNNDFYDDYTYEELQEVTHNEFQKEAMANVHDTLENFNGEFADAFKQDVVVTEELAKAFSGSELVVGETIEVKPALTFEEVVALHHAYSDFEKREIRAYFNGLEELNADDMANAYKAATLQLMGAHIIENREHSVDMSLLIDSEEGKEFYEEYHEMFLAAKLATGKEQEKLVREFYERVRADFPITEEVRMVGISHSQKREMIESYKLAVTPMIAASEILFRNYVSAKGSLNDVEVDFINDIGLCNYAFHKFERIEDLLFSCDKIEDNTNPTYEQYRNAIIKKLKELEHYYIDDIHRELTLLGRFQEIVNHNFVGKGVMTGGIGKGTGEVVVKEWQEVITTTHTVTHTSYHEEITRVSKPIPDSEKAKIDAQIEKENEEAKKKAEAESEKKRQELQKEADKEAEQIHKEIEEEEKDLQEKIKDANKKIEENNKDQDTTNNKPVNESDFGDHNVDFAPEHEDGNGNLNPSVENITTDGTGDQTNEELPDPNVTGAVFDQQAPQATTQSAPAPAPAQVQQRVEETVPAPAEDSSWITIESDQNVGEVKVIDENTWIEIPSYDAAVDAYVESLVDSVIEEETSEITK